MHKGESATPHSQEESVLSHPHLLTGHVTVERSDGTKESDWLVSPDQGDDGKIIVQKEGPDGLMTKKYNLQDLLALNPEPSDASRHDSSDGDAEMQKMIQEFEGSGEKNNNAGPESHESKVGAAIERENGAMEKNLETVGRDFTALSEIGEKLPANLSEKTMQKAAKVEELFKAKDTLLLAIAGGGVAFYAESIAAMQNPILLEKIQTLADKIAPVIGDPQLADMAMFAGPAAAVAVAVAAGLKIFEKIRQKMQMKNIEASI